jgi:hypothetical protein
MRLSSTAILQAVERLRDEWPALLGDDAEVLAGWLAAPGDDAEAVRQTVNRILDLLQRHSRARMRLGSELGLEGDPLRALRGADAILFDYEPLPGGPPDVPVGTLMVCPVDPTHYSQPLRQKGQPLFCPDHGVPLTPQE